MTEVETPAEESAETPTPETEETVIEETAEETPEGGAEETPEPVEETTPDLYELPDGRKVDATTLQREWKENFYPEYTRKSQKLADYEGVGIKSEEVPEWRKSDYEPKTWQEQQDSTIAEWERRQGVAQEKEQERLQGLETSVQAQLEEIKKTEPNIDENALFAHAMKYRFGADNVSGAFQNMQDMKKVVLKTEKRTAENIKRRAGEPIATGGGQPSSDEGYDPATNSQFSGALDFLKSVKK